MTIMSSPSSFENEIRKKEWVFEIVGFGVWQTLSGKAELMTQKPDPPPRGPRKARHQADHSCVAAFGLVA